MTEQRDGSTAEWLERQMRDLAEQVTPSADLLSGVHARRQRIRRRRVATRSGVAVIGLGALLALGQVLLAQFDGSDAVDTFADGHTLESEPEAIDAGAEGAAGMLECLREAGYVPDLNRDGLIVLRDERLPPVSFFTEDYLDCARQVHGIAGDLRLEAEALSDAERSYAASSADAWLHPDGQRSIAPGTAEGGAGDDVANVELNGSWSSAQTSLNGPELNPLVVSFDDRLIVLFTQNRGGDVAGEIYDPRTDTATPIAASDQIWRHNPAVAWTGSELLMVGGSNGPGIDDLALAYSPTTDEWRTLTNPPSDADAWDNNISGPGFWTGDRLVLWKSAFALDPATETWHSITPMPGPPRAFPATVQVGDDIVVWGGCDATIPQCDDAGSGLLVDGAIYDVDKDAWRSMAPSPLSAGVHPIGVASDGGVLFYAGYTKPDTAGAQFARYDLTTDTWIELPDPPITARRNSAAVWTGTHLILWGGNKTGTSWHDDGAAFDPMSNTWLTLPDPPPGSARDRHAMAWIADRLYIVGGSDNKGPLTFTLG